MIWVFVIGIVLFIGFRFFGDLSKDDDDLHGKTLDEKFNIIVHMINDAAYNGNGIVTSLSKREFNLYQRDSNQIVYFHYSTGSLTIIWKYKYFQKEIVHERTFNNVRNLSLFEQGKIADAVIKEMAIVVENHKFQVMSGAI